tara:strand:- start:902 stop:1435 length:534 start_codon:yes stop_codon:yes gene_type:complete
VDNKIDYVNDETLEKIEKVQSYMKSHDRIIFIDFGIHMDDASISQLFEPHEGVGCLVFPGVKDGIDWSLFKEKVRENSTEPVSQMGLHFDTNVGKTVSKDIRKVESTTARAWLMNTKNVLKVIKDKKTGSWKLVPDMFQKLLQQGVKIYAFTAAKLTMTYTHECVSNILNAAGVKVN